jgi:hypothetical protein
MTRVIARIFMGAANITCSAKETSELELAPPGRASAKLAPRNQSGNKNATTPTQLKKRTIWRREHFKLARARRTQMRDSESFPSRAARKRHKSTAKPLIKFGARAALMAAPRRNRLRWCEHMRACSADSIEDAVAHRNVKGSIQI